MRLLDINKFCKGLKPVTSIEILTKSEDFNAEGLHSEVIFGPIGSLQRKETFSFINLECYIIHPTMYRILSRLDGKIPKIISTEKHFNIVNGVLTQVEDEQDGFTGMNEFIKRFAYIKFRGDTEQREALIQEVHNAHSSKSLFINKIPVIPVEFRPGFKDEDTGRWIFDELNEIYTSILKRSYQVKGATGVLKDLLVFGMQTAVNSHDDYIRTRISKKSGLIRSQLLGKRVDYSARGVITPNPDLNINEVGIPLKLAVGLFEPFIIYQLNKSGKFSQEEIENEIQNFMNEPVTIDALKRVLRSIKNGEYVPPKLYNIIESATIMASEGRVVILKRDPVLHPESVKGFKPKIIKGSTIEINTLQVTGFNADFDGDAMGIMHPLSNEAQEEARNKLSRIESGKTGTSLSFALTKEMLVGIYILTKETTSKKSPVFIDEKDFNTISDPYIPVTYRKRNTTSGRAIFNSCFPEDFDFVDTVVNKSLLNKLLIELSAKYSSEIVINTAGKLKSYGFKFATIFAPTLTLDNMKPIPEIQEMKKILAKEKDPEKAALLIDKMGEILKEKFKDTGFYDLMESGAGKGWDQPKQIFIAKGVIADPEGNIMEPIAGSFSEGLNSVDFFNSAYGGRKGLVDRALNTADTGYLSRKLIYVLNSVEADPLVKDCKTDRTVDLKLDNNIIPRMDGRYVINSSGKVEKFRPQDYKSGQVVNFRSPIFCRSYRICHTCYGDLLFRHKTVYVGILAAQTIGEPGNQLIMRTFHTGGAVKIAKKDIIKNIKENETIFDTRKDIDINDYIVQTGNTLQCKKKCTIKIDKSQYILKENLILLDDKIKVNDLLVKIEFDELIFDIILDYTVFVYTPNLKSSDNYYVINYTPGEVLIEVTMEATEIKQQLNYIQRLLGGKEAYKDVPHLLKKILNIYSPPVSNMDIVHLEILLSNCLRHKPDLQLPARLGTTWNPTMINIKQIVFATSFVQGLEFEDIGKAIITGLTSKRDMPPSVMEKILTGDLVSKEGY